VPAGRRRGRGELVLQGRQGAAVRQVSTSNSLLLKNTHIHKINGSRQRGFKSYG
jgi:hypothetical protein